jgi:hypothetical protein
METLGYFRLSLRRVMDLDVRVFLFFCIDFLSSLGTWFHLLEDYLGLTPWAKLCRPCGLASGFTKNSNGDQTASLAIDYGVFKFE